MAPTFVVVPQWQGSVSPRAMRLSDGAEAIRGDLPSSVTHQVPVPAEAGDALDTGIDRFSTLVMVRERLAIALRGGTGPVLTIGGDNGVSLAAVEHASRQHPDDLAVVWLDAHPDLHTPDTSPSGGFTGMVLRAITGEGAEGLTLDAEVRVPLQRVVLGGARAIDPAEDVLIQERGIVSLPVEDLDSPDALVAALRATGARTFYLHLDLDVLDPAVLAGLADLYPFGLSVEGLNRLITALRADFELAGATIAGFAPASPEAATDDLPSILRIIGALTR
ncbi:MULTISPECIES: arginase family protein [Cryobacterium]|uniref:Arginase family protein n=1 Tax=Cryobacterium breve TaxID=1259258 RepID=A0ABY2J5T8_9MICO|nr:MULTISPECIES: arginase family protein [Cryobacterium]TFC90891.1 arginase family protein [Cryobacterium sp. TmT3-12]TFC99210.1 arginase family protein [Cryobacterium breve]